MEQSAVNIRQIYDALLQRSFSDEEKIFIENFIAKYELAEFLDSSIKKIETLAELSNSDNPIDINEVKTITYLALKKPNSAIATISDPIEKKKAKELLSKLGRIIHSEISQRTGMHHPEIRLAIEEGLDQAVHTEQYDKTDFEVYFPAADINIKGSKVTITKEKERKEYLLWDSTKANLAECARLIFTDYYYTRSINDFKLLFTDRFGQAILKCEPDKLDRLLLLFEKLRKEKIIQLKGGNAFWVHLKLRLVDKCKNPFDLDFRRKVSKLRLKSDTYTQIFSELNQIVEKIREPKR